VVENARAVTETEMEAEIERQQMNEEEADILRKTAGVFASPFMFATTALVTILIKTFIFGLVIGLIKRNK